ncbi:MAG: RES family NAD+ phosphorylase [Burkholderiaceae bacterium]|nr:RES family NAD+ phosphorylase [Burkholderiaceae bacterium]
MSTRTAPGSEARPWAGAGWRAVEAQHRNATLSLVGGDLSQQALLEDIVDAVKPPLPDDARGLHYLLATPFRHPPPTSGSRFRSAGEPGVFYGAEQPRTACAEVGYWRLRFWLDSEALSRRHATLQMTLFQFHGASDAAIDLSAPPFDRRRKAWTDPLDYRATQAFATRARVGGVELIRYESARDAPAGRCLAILSPAVFRGLRQPFRGVQQTWSLFIRPPDLTVWQRSLNNESFSFQWPASPPSVA